MGCRCVGFKVRLELVNAQTTLLIDEEIETVSARQAEILAI